MPSLAVDLPPYTMIDLEDNSSIEHSQVKRRRYDIDVDVTDTQRLTTNRCLDTLLPSPSPNSQEESIDGSPSSHHSSHISEPIIVTNSVSPNGVSCSMASTDVVDATVYNNQSSPNNAVSWLSNNGDVKSEGALTNSSSTNSLTTDQGSAETLYPNHSEHLSSYHNSEEVTKTNVTDYQGSPQFSASFYNNQMQVYQTVGASQQTPYNMNSTNSVNTGYYNGQNGQATSGYGVLSNAYAMTGSRMLNQSSKSSQGLTAQTGYLNPYSTAFGSATGGQVGGQTASTYTAYGSGYNAMGGSSYPGAPVPNSQTFNSAQQSIDYSAFGSFGQTGTYSYPCYPGQGYTSAYVAGGSASIPPVSTTSTTYQLAQIPPVMTDALTADHHQYSLEDNPSPPIKNDGCKSSNRKRSGRGPGRKQNNPSPEPENQLERVYIWDLDETLILFNSLLTGSYATKYGKDELVASELGRKMEAMIFNLADSNLFFNDLEVGTPECDQSHIDDVSSDDNGQDLTNYNFQADGFFAATRDPSYCLGAAVRGGVDCNRKLAFRYRKIKELYNKYRINVSGMLGPSKKDQWLQLRSEIENITDNWSSLALKCLNIIDSRPSCVNVLVTTTQLVPAIAKVLLYGLGSVFPVENIYSATKIGKEDCFQKIRLRFGKCTYVALGDGTDERTAAKNLDLPFWPISMHSDFAALHDALIKEHM